MRKIFNPILLISLAGIFLVGTFLCCCARQFIMEKSAKSHCCDKTGKADPIKCKDGCSSLVKSAETLKSFNLAPNATAQMPVVVFSIPSFKPVFTIKSVFANGPPGSISVVPLYTQFHSLRI